jgi:ComF family protein
LCPKGEIYFVAVRSFTAYEGPAIAILDRLKYRNRQEYAEVISPLMVRTLQSHYSALAFGGVVAVPLHPTRRRERGYNQAALLAEAISRKTGLAYLDHTLLRIRPTPSQTHLDRRARAKNVRDAFVVRNAEAVVGKTILLVDDVCTTGATLNECAQALCAAGATAVYGLTFCRATLD